MQKTLKHILPYLVFPALMGSSIWLTFWLIDQGFTSMSAFSVVSLLLLLEIFFLEKLIPHRRDWLDSDQQEAQDLAHSLFGTALGAGLGETLTHLVATAGSLWLARHFAHGFWPAQLPFWLQVVLVYLLADLGRYLQHRLMHHSPLLWRFHALHHSVERLCAFKASRSHVVERFFQPMFMFSLIFLLGAPAEVVFWFMMPNSFLGMIDHSNLDVKIGPLSYLINGPAEHRLHHSRDLREGNQNFGSALVIWDMLFGTYANPRPHHSPLAVGIENDATPRGFWGQLLEPFGLYKPVPQTEALAGQTELEALL